ncbi:NAD(P)/FAD-dependent oxidoreductase [Tundrisphaera sp. TA3]|uniref:NAD(P)/FAD-dependent oxidoreductase n=1 Tax=Tundrisphaera sp. TA3 TaxID=3435775 RepID=UPI003EBC7BCE
MTDRESRARDVIILGAGAAGLCAAIRAAELGRSVLLLEKNRRPGVKILMSGGTRCNLSNARGLRNLGVVTGPIDPAYDPRQAKGSRSIQDAFGAGGKFLGPSLKALPVEPSVALFEDEGVRTKIEGNGKIFPASDKASDVVDALVRRLSRTDAELRTLCPATEIRAVEGGGFEVRVGDGVEFARRVIIAVGGQSYPGCGTSGDGYAIARGFGHTIVEPRPALVPLRVEAEWVPGLKGLTMPDVTASIRAESGPALLERREALLFAHFGLTGPAILDVSRAVARREAGDRLDLAIDFVPDQKAEEIDRYFQTAGRTGKRLVSGLIPEALPRRLAEAVMVAAGIPPHRVGPDLSRDERKRLVAGIKGLRLPVAGTLGFAKAEVTSGGVALDEVDPRTLQSLRQPGLHFAGEVLDLDGLIGGYNFQAAWSTGWLAGESAKD